MEGYILKFQFSTPQKDQIILMGAFILGLILRVSIISQYGFSEDEILKVDAVNRYLKLDFSDNVQHPALSKLLMTISVLVLGESEFSIRLPNAIAGALIVYPIYYLAREISNKFCGFIAAYLWAVDIVSIGFTTTAKEDALLTLFSLLTILFFLKSKENRKFLIPTAISLGLAFASKYTALLLIPYLCAVFLHHNYRSSNISIKSYLQIAPVTFIVFMFFNFPLFLPSTLPYIYDHYFAMERFAPHRTGFIMSGMLFTRRPTFYLFEFLFLKMSIFVLIFAILGGIILSRNDRFHAVVILGWIIWILVVFTGRHGYTRYTLVIIPMIMILMAYGITETSKFILSRLVNSKIKWSKKIDPRAISASLFVLIWVNSLIIGLSIAPYYRMYVNEFGGGLDHAGYYFPQDSVYDYKVREAIEYINTHAETNTTIAIDVVIVAEYYGRADLNFVYIVSQPQTIEQWNNTISYVVVQQSRIYLENQHQISELRIRYVPEQTFEVMGNTVIEVYKLQQLN